MLQHRLIFEAVLEEAEFGTGFANAKKPRRKKKMKSRTKKRLSLGDLIAALFEESSKVTKNPVQQKVLVYAALKDLLRGRVHSLHPIAITV